MTERADTMVSGPVCECTRADGDRFHTLDFEMQLTKLGRFELLRQGSVGRRASLVSLLNVFLTSLASKLQSTCEEEW